MTKKLVLLAFFTGGMMLSGGEMLVGNGSFEGTSLPDRPNWEAKGNFWKGKGTVERTDQQASAGKCSLRMNGKEPDSEGQCMTGNFRILPDRDYKLAYSIRRDSARGGGHLILYYSTADKKEGMFVCHASDKIRKGALNQWHRVEGADMQVLFFLPKGSARQYIVQKNGIIRIPSEQFGKEAVVCRAQLYMKGNGNVWFDDIVIEPMEEKALPGKKTLTGQAAADREEADRLMLTTLERSDRERKGKEKPKHNYTLELPPKFDMTPLPEPDRSKYPASAVNAAFDGARVVRDGRPVFLMGCEMLDPFMCRLLGMDFWVNSAFGNRVNARKEGNTVKTSLSDLPFLEERVREHLRGGILVWIDLLQDYKIWHSKLLTENFPELFVTREAFFCWRPEEPRAQYLRHATWFNAVGRTRKYPIFVYELYNELSYEDHSPLNYRRFRSDMRRKYGSIANANRAWGTNFKNFDAAVPPGTGSLSEIMNNRPSPQLKAEWSLFTEKRFAEIAADSVDWMHRAVPGSRATLQAYNGLPFDYQNNFINPFLVNPKLDLTAAEFGGGFYPQWKGAENEEEIVSSLRSGISIGLSRLSSPEKPVIDGECGIGPGIKTALPENIVADLNGKWDFRPGATEKKENMKFAGFDLEGSVRDRGTEENWQKENLSPEGWTKVEVPGMWGKQGFENCYVGWYRKEFHVPDGTGKLFLAGSELADRGDIYLNGEKIHRTAKFNDLFSIDVTDKIRRGKTNTLAVRIFNKYCHDGYYWGGIRKPIRLVNVSFKAMPTTPDQLAFMLSLRALQGYSGLCWSYFYWNWMDDTSGALLNPERHTPEALAAIPSVKNRINDLGALIYNRKRAEERNVAITYSLASARAYLPKNTSLPSERVRDLARDYAASVFTNRGVSVVSDDVLNDLSRLRRHRALVLRLNETVSKRALENIRKFAEDGGLVIVDRHSLSRNEFDGSPLDVSDLLGARRGRSFSRPIGGIRVNGTALRHAKTVPALHADAGQYAVLTPGKGTEVFAESGDLVLGTIRKTGKGAVATFTPELSASDLRKVYRMLFDRFGIAPELDVQGGDFTEVYTRNGDGKYLWSIFNWGKDETLSVRGSVPEGFYTVREAFSEESLKSPSGNTRWRADELRNPGIRRTVANLKPCHYLIESDKTVPLKLTRIPAAHRKALEEYYLPVWRDVKNPKKRVLWYGDSHYTPPVLPSAIRILRDMGIAVDFLSDKGFTPEVTVVRGGKKMLESLNAYDLIVIPRSRSGLGPDRITGIPAYLKQGGSVLVLANHVYDMHSYYNFRMKGLPKAVPGIGIVDGAVRDSAHARSGEERRFDTANIHAHEITRGVKKFSAMGATTVELKNGFSLLSPEDSAKGVGRGRSLLAVREDGPARVAVCGDTEWLSTPGLALNDNAVLWSNLAAWLCRVPPLPADQAKKAATPPVW